MEQKLIPAPIDNKNLLEDPFEDEVFGNFYACCNHRKNGLSALIEKYNIGKEIYEEYKKEFSSWQCEDNPGLVVKFSGEKERRLFVSFFFKDED